MKIFNPNKTLKNFFSTKLEVVREKITKDEVIPFNLKRENKKGKGFFYKGNEFIDHSLLNSKQKAFHTLSKYQKVLLSLIVIILTAWFLIDWHLALIVVMSVLTFLYFVDLLFNLYLISRSFSKPKEIRITSKRIEKLGRTNWPVYTVLCPLYKEWQVVPQFIKSISNLDYPKNKLQVLLLLEQDDTETIQKIDSMNLPSYFQKIIVPHSEPKTKPKACNYGLKFATGEYVVIYDAEDMPDPLQLKKVVMAFEKADEKTICIQAKLNFYNPNQNILTRVFTAEYSLWFDLILNGLHSIKALIPLGGTSNHFRTHDLIQTLQGWDSFNVTEDADLGVRLVKQGYKTSIINSVTLEEANSSIANWLSQRSRWVKGYMQTFLVHNRSISEFKGIKGKIDFLIFQLVIGGKIISPLVNPIMWVLTISYFLLRTQIGIFVESLFPGPVLYMGVTSFVLGNFLYVYYYMLGSIKHGHNHLVKYMLLTPLYWLGMSIAAWIAIYQLIKTPHYWAKTKHGLHLDKSLEDGTLAQGVTLKRLALNTI